MKLLAARSAQIAHTANPNNVLHIHITSSWQQQVFYLTLCFPLSGELPILRDFPLSVILIGLYADL
jgi:hypothetical protein